MNAKVTTPLKKKNIESARTKIYPILIEINQAVSRHLDLNASLKATLEILQNSYKITSGLVLVPENGHKSLRAIVGVGFHQAATNQVFTNGENLSTRVAQTGKPIIIPEISKEPLFSKRQFNWDFACDGEQSFFSIPIVLDYQVLGVLSVCLGYQINRDYDSTQKFLTLVAAALLPPLRMNQVLAAEHKKLIDENVILKTKLKEEYSFHNIIGNSHKMRDVYEQVAQVARTDTTVFLRGESGTGKELIAEALHYNSLRSEKPFIRVNCAAIPENLIESEFFGYEKGAFTGAVTRKPGRFELADGGTIFLDEIGDLSPMTQVKLLRVLQEQTFERVGGTQTIKVNVRVITASHANLEELIAQSKFREDLYYRINVFPIYLPPLRDRKSDILLLADHFMLKYGRQYKKSVKRISTPAIDMLMRYHWPGNVRELENCIERAVVICKDQVIHSYHLPPTLQTAESSNTIARLSLEQAIAAYEKELIQDTLKYTRGNQAKAARMLETTDRIVRYKIKIYQIDVDRFKN